jgi:rhodanese-related sulfurtransferase
MNDESLLSQSLQDNHVVDITVEELQGWIEAKDVVLVDVREEEEYSLEHIEESSLHCLSSFEPSNVPLDDKKKLVFYCRSGRRSCLAGHHFVTSFPDKTVYNLKGGILAWKSLGNSTKKK